MAYFHLPDSDSDSDSDMDSYTIQILWERDSMGIQVSGKMYCIILCSHRVLNQTPSPNLNPIPAVEISHKEIQKVFTILTSWR